MTATVALLREAQQGSSAPLNQYAPGTALAPSRQSLAAMIDSALGVQSVAPGNWPFW